MRESTFAEDEEQPTRKLKGRPKIKTCKMSWICGAKATYTNLRLGDVASNPTATFSKRSSSSFSLSFPTRPETRHSLLSSCSLLLSPFLLPFPLLTQLLITFRPLQISRDLTQAAPSKKNKNLQVANELKTQSGTNKT